MDVLLVVDMQEGLLQGKPKHDLSGVIERINRLAARVRERGGCVLFVQHDGPRSGDEQITAIKADRRNGTIIDSAARIPAMTITKHAAVIKMRAAGDWVVVFSITLTS